MADSVIDDWSRRRTYDWRAWTLDDLVAAKTSSGTTVSLVVPARNEAGTVGGIVRRLHAELRTAVPLVDEIVVIDSDSDDATGTTAAAAGAAVYRSAEIRPDLGSYPGKGEAVWKSQLVTSGDVLVFVDADLTHWGTHFVTGLLGPLLADPDIELVKGYYDRPLIRADGEAEVDTLFEGGRVTELVARPLLASRWPELGGVVQPLAGEWAIRRSLLESLRVPVGYGVELGILVDTYATRGLDAIGQVDLGLRGHSHQHLRDLGTMALEILAVADRRAGHRPDEPETISLRQFHPTDGRTVPTTREVPVVERPPAADLGTDAPGAGREGAVSC